MLEAGKKMSRPILESILGFLVYVDRKYQGFKPCLKGIYLTIYIWIPGGG